MPCAMQCHPLSKHLSKSWRYIGARLGESMLRRVILMEGFFARGKKHEVIQVKQQGSLVCEGRS